MNFSCFGVLKPTHITSGRESRTCCINVAISPSFSGLNGGV